MMLAAAFNGWEDQARRLGARGKTAEAGGGISLPGASGDLCRNVPEMGGVRSGFGGEVMLHFESGL